MKLSDYVADFLAKQGIRHAFVLSGGASVHLIHSVAHHAEIAHICVQHEQAAAMAADAYARVTGNLGATLTTSGPGMTNLITGICCAYYDSVPVLFITGQVATFRNKGNSGVRQLGFQETDTVEVCKPITKYAVIVSDAKRIRYELEKACWIAKSGRPGPVIVDIPDNIQRKQIDPRALEAFQPPAADVKAQAGLERQVDQCLELIARAKRPVVVLGWGVRLAKAEEAALRFLDRLGLPVLTSWGVVDLIPHKNPLLIGTFGTHGSRFGNFAVQNADLVVSVGCRLDTHGVGSPFSSFARGARKVVVDIDPAELGKFAQHDMPVDIPIAADAKKFLSTINLRLNGFVRPDISPWLKRIADWKQRYPVVRPAYFDQQALNPYVFVKALSNAAVPGDVIFVDTGCALAWMSQAFEFKEGQRFFHAFNNTPMGYSLPGAIGASIALDGKPVICVTGDGALQINIQELITVVRHELPIKIFLVNNHGHSMIRQTQDQWLDSEYIASSIEGGLAFPDFVAVAKAYGFKTVTIAANNLVQQQVAEVLKQPGAMFCNLEIHQDHRVIPQVKYGRPIEDSEPLLDREEFMENMIVEPMKASLT